MATYHLTVDDARSQAPQDAQACIEIEHPHGIRYVNTLYTPETLQRVLAKRPMPEIKRIIRTVVDYRIERHAAKEAALEVAVPGIHELIRLSDAARDEADRYHREFEQMMEDGDNDGANPPRAEDRSAGNRLRELAAANPRAALYLKARRQNASSHWADNTGKGAAGTHAMEILASGGSIEDAETALAVRWEVVD